MWGMFIVKTKNTFIVLGKCLRLHRQTTSWCWPSIILPVNKSNYLLWSGVENITKLLVCSVTAHFCMSCDLWATNQKRNHAIILIELTGCHVLFIWFESHTKHWFALVSGFLSVLLGQNLLSCKIYMYIILIFSWVVIHFTQHYYCKEKERKYRQYTIPGKG